MRERIYDIIKLWCPNQSYGWNEAMNAICKLLSEEIEKVENPYEDRSAIIIWEYQAFEKCRQKILNLLRPKENVGTTDSADNSNHTVVGNAEI